MNFLSFDIETSIPVPFKMDWWNHPELLKIACVSYHATNMAKPYVKHMPDYSDFTVSKAISIVRALENFVDSGYTIVTFNGHKFDFRALGAVSGLGDHCLNLSLNHIDMWANYFMLTGNRYMSVSKLANLINMNKFQGMTGKHFPAFWANGEYEKCLQYSAQDAIVELALAQYVQDNGKFPDRVSIDRLLTVGEIRSKYGEIFSK